MRSESSGRGWRGWRLVPRRSNGRPDAGPWSEGTRSWRRGSPRIRVGPDPGTGFRWLYVALAAVAVAATVITIQFQDNELVERFGPNAATETLAILVTVVFVHRLLQRQERARRLRGSIGALRRGSRALSRMTAVWAALIKGALTAPPVPQPGTLGQLLTSDRTEDLMFCDPGALRSGQAGEDTWLRWAGMELAAAQQALREIIATYAGALDAEYVEALDDLIDDEFLQLVLGLASQDADPRVWRVRLNAARGARETHFLRLLDAVDLQNLLASDAARFRNRRTAPRTEALGIELARDHDLKVPVAIPPSWWDASPRPGSLRVRREVVRG